MRAHTVSSSFALSCAAACALAGSSCRRADLAPTQIVLHIDSQLEAGTTLRNIRVKARRGDAAGREVFNQDFDVSGGSFRLPGEVGLFATDPGDRAPVFIEVQAGLTSGGFFTVQLVSSFVPGQTRVVPVLLTRSCAASAASGTCASCSACGCEPIRFDVDGGVPGGSYVAPFAGARAGTCELAQPPELPRDLPNPIVDAGVSPGTGLCERGPCFAVRRLTFDWPTMANPNRWRRHGWDLDGNCSTGGQGGATCRNAAGVVEDGENGRDNAFASRLGPYLQTLMNVSEERINIGIESGLSSMGIELRGYAGTGDDSTVEAVFFPIAQGRPMGMPIGTAPRWDGNDVWALDRFIMISADAAVSRGYVAGSRVVLRLRSQTPLAFATEFGQSRLLVSGGIASGTVHCGGSQLGPMELGGFLEIGQLSRDLPLLGLCDPLQQFAVTTALGQSADLNVVGDAPVNNPNVDCNAISFGVTLEPVRMLRLEGELGTPLRGNPCDAGATPPDASATDASSTDASATDGGSTDAGATDARAADASRG
jgi:hypothetical protein